MSDYKELKFGGVLRDIRTSRSLTIRQFSETCYISPTYICDLENGHRKATMQVMNNISNTLSLTEEENKNMMDAFSYDRLQIPTELLYYLIDNDLLESVKAFKEYDEKGTAVKGFAKELKKSNQSK